ncbi:MAG: rod shape-determining protein [bacterium]|nr:rod shape-determining protein [bacterium]
MENILTLPFIKRFSSDIAIDLGSENSRISSDTSTAKYSESSLVAYDKTKSRTIAVGDQAKKMLGRTPPNIKIIPPIKNGAVGNLERGCEIIELLLKRLKNKSMIKPRFMAAMPEDSNELERRSVFEALRLSGSRITYLIQDIIAAAVGSDIPVMEANGGIIADLGSTSSRIAIISLGGIVEIKKTNSAGESMTKDIISALLKRHGLVIGDLTAEKIKKQLGSAVKPDQNESIKVRGRGANSGLPEEAAFTSEEAYEALYDSLSKITETIRSCIESSPHGLITDVIEKGIVICGGIAHMRGLDRMISSRLNIKCRIAPEPSFAVLNGMKKIMASPQLMKFFFENSNDRIGETV